MKVNKIKILTLIPLACLTLAAQEPSTVQKLCGYKNAGFKRSQEVENLEAAVCTVAARYEDQEKIQAKAKDVLAILNTMRPSAEDKASPMYAFQTPLLDENETTKKLDQALEQLSTEINAAQKRTNLKVKGKTPLEQMLINLEKNFGTADQRWKNPEGYMAAMIEVLRHTPTGKRVVDCFEKKDSERIQGSRFEFTAREKSSGENGATLAQFELMPVKGARGTFDKVARIDPGPNAFQTLAILAHEFQHSCNTAEMTGAMLEIDAHVEAENTIRKEYLAKFKEVYLRDPPQAGEAFNKNRDANGKLVSKARLWELDEIVAQANALFNKASQLQAKLDIMRATDELRAYQMTPVVFKELAVVDPLIFCSGTRISTIFTKKPLSLGDYMQSLEEQTADGTFVHTLVDSYSRIAGYDVNTFYDRDPDTFLLKTDAKTGLPLLKPEVKEAFKKQGFHVSP